DLGEGGVRIVVEPQMNGDAAHALGAGGLDVVDAVGAGDDALERRRDKAANQVGIGAHVSGGYLDDRDVAARVLPHGERADGLEPGDQNDQVDDHCQDRPPDEKIRDRHQLSSGLGEGLLPGCTSLFTRTEAPLRSLKTPEVTTSSPDLTPESTAI